MAEAMVVEDRASVPKRFFCHMCNVEINIPSSDFTCPHCSNGFVEELPANAPELMGSASNIGGSINNARSAGAGSLSGNGSATEMPGSTSNTSTNSVGSGGSGLGIGMNVDSLRNDIVSFLTMRNVPNLEITIEPSPRHGNVLQLSNIGGPSGSNSGGSNTSVPSNNGGRRPVHLDRLDNMLFDFLQSLPINGATAEIVTGPGTSVPGNSHMFFMGNPGDYAWGREGLDTIVTQMLNQMETSGPPPLSAQLINEIPSVKITAEEVERKIQCSICWEDFILDESVRKLRCSHLYHENCIVPWLNLHSTCPICRKSLAEEETANAECAWNMPAVSANDDGGSQANLSVPGTVNAAQHRSSSSQTTASSEPANNQSSTSNQPNNVFTFDEDNMFLD